MRESIGGGWIMTIVVLFIVLFSGYLAVSINYSKAFKVKNFILSAIERNEGFSGSCTRDQLESGNCTFKTTQTEIYSYLKEFGYYSEVINENYCEDNGLGKYMAGGYCLKKICQAENSIGGGGNYYKVTTFLKIEFPLISFVFKVPISGETKLIYYDFGDIECSN